MSRRLLPGLFLSLLLAGATTPIAHATEIWSGRTFGFSKAPFANPALATSQDRITPLVWLTRASVAGLYNANLEVAYTHFSSPAGTEWATGDAVNHASLTFQTWEAWASSDPPATVGIPACVHLIAEDIYLDIQFTTWGGPGSGGYFSYLRATIPAVPVRKTSWAKIKDLYR
jgi:hypothetical protein